MAERVQGTSSPDVILGRASETGNVIRISDAERRSGMYTLGVQGSGKTNFLKSLIVQDMANGHGVFFLDPHGDAIKDLLTYIPSGREKDVIVVDRSR